VFCTEHRRHHLNRIGTARAHVDAQSTRFGRPPSSSTNGSKPAKSNDERNLMSIRDTPVGSGTETPVGSGRFAMVHWDIGTDGRLKDKDVRVYFVLAACRRGTEVSVGTRWIATCIHTSQRRVLESLRRLAACGYVSSDPVKNGARAVYHLTAEQFGTVREKRTVDRATSKKSLEVQPVHHCAKCKKAAKLMKTGWCRSCHFGTIKAVKLRRGTVEIAERLRHAG
jgi:hypothetical protein